MVGKRYRRANYGDNFLSKQPEHVKKVVECLMVNPKAGPGVISQETGLKFNEVQCIMRSNSYIVAVRKIAYFKTIDMIAAALKGLEDSLSSLSADVKFRACVELLKSEGILGPTKIDFNVTAEKRSAKEMWESVQRAAQLPPPTIEGELIGT